MLDPLIFLNCLQYKDNIYLCAWTTKFGLLL